MIARAVRWIAAALTALGLCFSALRAPGGPPAPGRRAAQEALKAYGSLVGPWKGVGQPQRSSSRGAWTEKAQWAWKLSADSAALELTIERGKYVKSARLRPGSRPGWFDLDVALADGSERDFSGQPGPRGQLVLTAAGPATEGPRRVTLSPLHDTRFLLLLEAQDANTEVFYRLAEVGYTRQGVPFAAGDSYPPCIVTDGRGTIEVKYQGRSYWVCCSGCKDLFDADPAGVIAEAAARRKAAGK